MQRVAPALIDKLLELMPNLVVWVVVFAFPFSRSRIEAYPATVYMFTAGLLPIARNFVVLRGIRQAHGSILGVIRKCLCARAGIEVLSEVQEIVPRATVKLLGHITFIVKGRCRARRLISIRVEGQPLNLVAIIVIPECLPILEYPV